MNFLRIITSLAISYFAGVSAQSDLRTDFRQAIHVDLQDSNTPLLNTPHRAMSTTLSNGLGVYGESARGSVSSIGTPRIPVIMVSYPDLDFLPSTTPDKVNRWLSEEGYHDEPYAIGSVTDYFRDNSYGLFVPTFEVVAQVKVSQPLAYYGAHSGNSHDARAAALVCEAIDLATAQGVEFSNYTTDGSLPIVSIVHAGPGEHEDYGYKYPGQMNEEYIWAHYTTLNYNCGGSNFASYIITNEAMRDFDEQGQVKAQTLTGIGTFCHEFCHALGLPDTYDINGSTGGSAQTPGFWDLMDYQFMLNGYRPSCLSAYERCCLGWLDIPELPSSSKDTFTLLPLDAPSDADDTANPLVARAYRITNPDNSSEYLILENRQPATWHVDCYGKTQVLGTGMLVWHIDYDANAWNGNRVNVNSSHRRVYTVPADGVWQSPGYGKNEHYGDLFPGAQHVNSFTGNLDSYYTGPISTSLYNITETDDGLITFTTSSTTGLNPSVATTANPSYYDLYGRCHTHLPKGIILQNGQKTFVRP